jgi:methionine-rich copper-binding protein CopC
MKKFALIVMFIGSQCFAHAFLDHADPRVGSEVRSAPAQVTIWFTEEFESSETFIQVFSATGSQVDLKNSVADKDDASVEHVSLPPNLPAGLYKVQWQAVCLAGHTTKGSYTFTVTK